MSTVFAVRVIVNMFWFPQWAHTWPWYVHARTLARMRTSKYFTACSSASHTRVCACAGKTTSRKHASAYTYCNGGRRAACGANVRCVATIHKQHKNTQLVWRHRVEQRQQPAERDKFGQTLKLYAIYHKCASALAHTRVCMHAWTLWHTMCVCPLLAVCVFVVWLVCRPICHSLCPGMCCFCRALSICRPVANIMVDGREALTCKTIW